MVPLSMPCMHRERSAPVLYRRMAACEEHICERHCKRRMKGAPHGLN